MRTHQRQKQVERLSLGSQFQGKLSRRSQLDISMDILDVLKEGGERPTQIMYRANLSYETLQTKLKTLAESGLLKWVEGTNRKKYEVTDKGRSVLSAYRKIKQEIDHALSSHVDVPDEVFTR